MSTTGKLTPKGSPSLRRQASADDPIYKHGFSIGGMNLKNSSGNTLAKNSKKENKKELSSRAEAIKLATENETEQTKATAQAIEEVWQQIIDEDKWGEDDEKN